MALQLKDLFSVAEELVRSSAEVCGALSIRLGVSLLLRRSFLQTPPSVC